ncbi:WXG100-like domain-containing protein [Actinophytocola gossypii]|uniref:Outer membrane channel protein CpnT-like N-terminal domain-containing protein n=1 Tax=Actinophytocola gossypii TaxID=2812003 RepID=A0ABT2JEJ9_9PSEU|nr:hypothetical protein [Actinophytocola gossypii]MCT2586303.1 hypothetical protein [Actinophytocola gossypii]
MPIPEPSGPLWWMVKAFSGWPETNEDAVRQLADGWRAGAAAVRTAAEFDQSPLAAAWPDDVGKAFGGRIAHTTNWAIDTAVGMDGLITQATRLADAVTHAKTSIRSLISAGGELAEGSAYFPGLSVNVLQLVPRLAGEVNDILARTAAIVAADPAIPAPPPPPPPSFTAGEFGSDPNTLDQHATEPLYDVAAAGALPLMPDGAERLAHYLDGTGTTMDVDPDEVIAAVPELGTKVDEQLNAELRRVTDQAVANGDYGRPIPFSSDWSEKFNITPGHDLNWHVAMGHVQHSVTGVATVLPPTDPGGTPRVEVTYQTHFHDPYNWNAGDPNKAVHLGGVPVPGTYDTDLAQFHRAGTAQEYDTTGSSAPHTETREVR